MYISNFNDSDKLAVISMLQERRAYIPSDDEWPEIGFVAYERGEPIAAAFLRKVEGGFGQLDGLVSNMLAPGEMRHTAIDLVVEKVLESAKLLNIKSLLSYSVDAGTLIRSEKHGFVKLPHTLIVCPIR